MRTAQYLPAVVAILLSAGLGAAVSLFAGRFGPKSRATAGSAKGQAFEGGSEVVGQAHAPLALRLYPMLLAFLVFDVAVALLLPWALLIGNLSAGRSCGGDGCVSTQQLLGVGVAFGLVLSVAWVHVRGTPAANWNA